jgi:hypothetical protein
MNPNIRRPPICPVRKSDHFLFTKLDMSLNSEGCKQKVVNGPNILYKIQRYRQSGIITVTRATQMIY